VFDTKPVAFVSQTKPVAFVPQTKPVAFVPQTKPVAFVFAFVFETEGGLSLIEINAGSRCEHGRPVFVLARSAGAVCDAEV
jgi:hypothetical protein